MVHSDITTLDLHGDAPDEIGTGGWPALVDPLLRAAGTLQYDPDKLSPSVRESSRAMVDRLMRKARDKGQELLEAAAQSGSRKTSETSGASGLATGAPWGFKAPASLSIFPMLARWHAPVRLIHVVRDGRDIAMSGNTSPVQKFWGPLFGSDNSLETAEAARSGQRAKAALLWSRWNTATLNWATPRQSQGQSAGRDDTPVSMSAFSAPRVAVGSGLNVQGQPKPLSEYAVVRVEDLLLGAVSARWAALKRLADLVGSPRSD